MAVHALLVTAEAQIYLDGLDLEAAQSVLVNPADLSFEVVHGRSPSCDSLWKFIRMEFVGQLLRHFMHVCSRHLGRFSRTMCDLSFTSSNISTGQLKAHIVAPTQV
jgi:hypothetical protein